MCLAVWGPAPHHTQGCYEGYIFVRSKEGAKRQQKKTTTERTQNDVPQFGRHLKQNRFARSEYDTDNAKLKCDVHFLLFCCARRCRLTRTSPNAQQRTGSLNATLVAFAKELLLLLLLCRVYLHYAFVCAWECVRMCVYVCARECVVYCNGQHAGPVWPSPRRAAASSFTIFSRFFRWPDGFDAGVCVCV